MGCIGSKTAIRKTAVKVKHLDGFRREPKTEQISSHTCSDKTLNKAEHVDLKTKNDQPSILSLENDVQQLQSSSFEATTSLVSIPVIPLVISIPPSVNQDERTGIIEDQKSALSCDKIKLPLPEKALKKAKNVDLEAENNRYSALNFQNEVQQLQSSSSKAITSPVSIPVIPLIISIPPSVNQNERTGITEERKSALSCDEIESPLPENAIASRREYKPIVTDYEPKIAIIMARRKLEKRRQQSPNGSSSLRNKMTRKENFDSEEEETDGYKLKEETEQKMEESLNKVANTNVPKFNEVVIQEHHPFFHKVRGLGEFDSMRKKVAELIRDGNISQRKRLVSNNDRLEPTHDYLLRKRVLSHSAIVHVDHTLECQVISHCIMQTKEVHPILKNINLNLSRTEQSYVVQGLLNPVYDIHNGHDDVARTFNLHLMDANLNQKKGAAVKDFLSRQYMTNPGKRGGEIRFENYFKDATVVKEGLVDSDELVGKMEKLLRDVEDPYRNYLTTVRSVLSSKGVAEERFEALSETVNQVYDKMFESDRSR